LGRTQRRGIIHTSATRAAGTIEETHVDPSPDTSAEPQQEGPPGTPEDDARRFVEQLRSTPAEQVVADVLSTLLTAAEVKLGRRDARLFIDLSAAMSEYAGPYVSDELGTQVAKVLGQLRLAQVSAESTTREKGEPEANDLSRTPTPPATAARAEATAGGGAPESPLSKLWVPGR
jgi:hypothetical protein